MLQGNMCKTDFPSWNREISDLTMSKQVDLTGNYAANMDHFTCGKEAKASSNNTKWLVQLWWYTLQQTSNDNSWSTIYDSATSTSVLAWRFLQVLVTLLIHEKLLSITDEKSRGNAIYFMDDIVWYLVACFIKKNLHYWWTLCLKKCSFLKNFSELTVCSFPRIA